MMHAHMQDDQFPDPTRSLLEFTAVCKQFASGPGKTVNALDTFSLGVNRGEIVGLVGADGAGKTTLLRIAAGLLVPSSGTATVLGLDSVADTLEIQSRVGYMPQKFGLYQDLTVAENMTLYGDLQDVPIRERSARFDRLLAMTGLARFTSRRAGALSGGMKQKLGLACALIKSPELLLLDEPTVGVDPVSRRELWKIIDQLVAEEKIGVLVATAYLDEAERCDEVAVIHEGKLLDTGPPAHFVKPMQGRTILITPASPNGGRALYTRLAGSDGILDITLRSGKVRCVLSSHDQHEMLADRCGADGAPAIAPPNFEDAFMALIPGRDKGHVPTPSPMGYAFDAGDEVVSTTRLCKRFGQFTAVNDLSFGVRRGEIFGLLGPNGAGKSTTFRMLCGLLPPSEGELSVAGYDLRTSPARARGRLGYMAQQFSLYGQLTVRENLTFFGRAYGLIGKKLTTRIEWAFDEFSLARWSSTPAAALPGGNKQRLAMAAALLHEPDILFLDEPTSGVDPFARREFWLRINLFAEQGPTVVVTTHFMEEAEYCDRMLIMDQGQTLAMGSPAEIRALARTAELTEPSMDDAFIALAEGNIGGNAVSRGVLP